MEVDDIYKEFISLTNDFNSLPKDKIIEIIDAQRDRCKTIAEIISESRFFIKNDFSIENKLIEKYFNQDNLPIFNNLYNKLDKLNDWNMSNIQDVIDNTIHELNIDTPRFAKPIRVALTGTLSSPSIDLTIYLLGKEACLQRISSVKTLIT